MEFQYLSAAEAVSKDLVQNLTMPRCGDAPTACSSGRGTGLQMAVSWVSKRRGLRPPPIEEWLSLGLEKG